MQAGLASTQPRVGCDAWITSPLNRLSHPRFTVWVRILARGERQPRRDAVTGGVLDWLNRLDPDELAGTPATDLPRRHQHAGEWHFDLRAIPMSASTSRSDRGLAGVYPGAPGYDNTASALKTALRENSGCKSRSFGAGFAATGATSFAGVRAGTWAIEWQPSRG